MMNHAFLKSLLTAYLLLLTPLVCAQTLKETIATTTGLITFLTSQESVSAGIYSTEKTDPASPQSNFSTFKIPYRHLYDKKDDSSQWSMLIGYGRFDMTQEFNLDQSKWEANSLSAGIGYSKDLTPQITWFSRVELAYTQINHRYHADASSLPSTTTDTLNFDWQTQTLSIIPSIGMKVPVLPKHTQWLYQPRITYLHTTSILERNDLEKVSANSVLVVNRLNFGEPWRVNFHAWGVALNPQLSRTDAFGNVEDGLSTRYWYEANLNFRLKSMEHKWWDNFTYGFSYLHGEHFRGGQLSISFNLERFGIH
ncbi:MAG: Solitary outer membrane autotransporter beta-barrel domain [Hydrogenovibrio sp.]|nr:Solitary outer membrane autotransporter beta-barrel domain [Hydrogenovibrio sp.]